MAWTSARLLKVAGVGVGILGTLALFVIVARTVAGQAAEASQRSPLVELAQWTGGSAVGIEVRDVDEADVKREKLPASMGAVVEDVRSDGAAAKAGMRAGDVIVSFDGERVRSAKHFERLVSETPAGRTVDVAAMRAGAKVNLKLTVQTVDAFAPFKQYSYSFNRPELRPEAWTLSMPRFSQQYGFPAHTLTSRARLGIGVTDLTEQLGEYFGTAQGALVTTVDDATAAKTAGLKAGDVITKVNGAAVRDSNDLRLKLREAKGETKITVMRDRKEVTLTAKLE